MRQWTGILIIATIVIWALYDIVPFLTAEDGDTISEMIQSASFSHPIVATAAGILIGHFFWPLDVRKDKEIKRLKTKIEELQRK